MALFKSKRAKSINPPSEATLQREQRELRRLERLIDTVFAIVIVMIAVDVPAPDQAELLDIGRLVGGRLDAMIMSAVGIAVVLVYWFQSNLLLGNLARTNGKHAILSVMQVFMVLTYLLTVSLGVEFGNDTLILVAQSVTAALVGITGAASWWYASYNRRLLTDEVNDEEISALRIRVLAEPLTAILTIALAFVSPIVWELGWLSYPLFAAVLRRVGVHNRTEPTDARISAASE